MTVCAFARLRRTLVHVARPLACGRDHPGQAPGMEPLARGREVEQAVRQVMHQARADDDWALDVHEILRGAPGFGEQEV